MIHKIPIAGLAAGGSTLANGTLQFSNSNGVSFGLAGSTLTASHNGLTSQSNQAFSAAGGTSAFQTLSFNNANGLTFSNVGGAVQASYTVPVVPAQFTAGFSTQGNTLGNTGLVTGRMLLVGTNNITLSGSTNGGSITISISGGAGAAGNTGFISAGAATASLGTVVFSNSNGVSFGVNGQTVTASHNGMTVQTNQTVGWYASSNTTLTSSGTADARSLSVRAIGSLTAGFSNGELLLSAPAALTTADLSQNSSNYFRNWKLTGNTAGTTSSAQGTDFWLGGGNGITVSGSSNTISFSVGNYITTADLSQNSSKYGQNWKLTGNTAGTTSSAHGTDIWFSGGNNITLSGNSNTIVVSAVNQSNQSAIKGLGVSNTGNTAGNTGLSTGIDWVLAGTNNITVSQSTAVGGPNTIWFSAPNAGGAGQFSAGVSNVGNTSGQTGITGTRLIFAGGNNVTLSQATDANGGTLTVSAFNQSNQSIGFYALGNTTQNSSTTLDARTVSLNGLGAMTVGYSNGSVQLSAPATSSLSATGVVSISTNGSTISIGAPGPPNRSFIEILQGERLTTVFNGSVSQFSRRPIFCPFWVDGTGMQPKTLQFMISGAGSSNRSFQVSFSGALYSLVNSTQASLFGTCSDGFAITASSQSTVWNGVRVVQLTGMTGTMTNEGRWIYALAVSANGHDATNCNFNFYGADNMPSISGFMIGGTTSATNNTSHLVPFWGVYSATTNAFPNSFNVTQVQGGNSASVMDLYGLVRQI